MTVPNDKDRAKKEEFKKLLIKKIGGERASEKSLCSIIRSNIRQTWMFHPVRLLKLEMTRIYDMDDSTRTKFLWECECCKGKFKGTDVQTDHINGEHQLKTLADVEQFARSILDVTLDDMQILCKNCHEIKTYAERYNISFEDATIEKVVILWMKTYSVDEQKILLTLCGFPCNNTVARKDSYRELIKSNSTP